MKIKIKNPVYGVPITVVDKIADDGFIHCSRNGNEVKFELFGQMANTKVEGLNFGYPFINKKKKYARILIQKVWKLKLKIQFMEFRLLLLIK